MFEKINTYYLSHLHELTFPKQFHFASRQWLWDKDSAALEILKSTQKEFCGDNPPESIHDILEDILDNQSPEFGTKNAANERAPYFEKYPLVKKALPLLFRLLFIETIYGIDARDKLKDFVSVDELEQLADSLQKDPRAVAILSTHACNFYYLYYRFFKKDEAGFDINFLYEAGKNNYDLANKTHLQLYVYLYTHCIIGESIFYKRNIPNDKQAIYLKMCRDLDDILSSRFSDINLDNKFEMLVCFKICGYKSSNIQKVHEEAQQSWSDDGDYLIDRINNNPQTDNITLEKSEHRNVLAILSERDFKPTDQAIR